MIAALERYRTELEGILSRFKKTRDAIHINDKDEGRYRELALELRDLFDDELADGGRHSRPLLAYFNDSVSNFLGSPSFAGVERVKGVVVAALARVQRNPLALRTAALQAKARGAMDPDVILTLAERLHSVARQLRHRHDGRPTLDVTDEHDLQDLFRVLLAVHFDDIRREESAPSHAGAGSRMDFLLPDVETVVELKMTRPGLSANELGKQLIVDIERYKKHPGCRILFCVVYDPEARISNPRGLENDLTKEHDQLAARVIIVPR